MKTILVSRCCFDSNVHRTCKAVDDALPRLCETELQLKKALGKEKKV